MLLQLVDAKQVAAALRVLHGPGDVFEIRALEAKIGGTYRPCTVSGYFDDPEAAASAVQGLREFKAVYVTLNPVIPDLLARASNRLKEARSGLTADKDVLRRSWLLIDCDPVRPSDISSTEAEHQRALDRAGYIQETLSVWGWPEPILADSGNGAHLLYKVDLPNDEASTVLMKRCLAALQEEAGCGLISIDQTVFNPARITKLYGTMARKGDSTQTRAHRMSRLLTPGDVQSVRLELLEALAALAPAPVNAQAGGGSARPELVSSAWDEGRLDKWLRTHGLEAGPAQPWNGGIKRLLATCPFCGESTKSAVVTLMPSGILGFKCQYNRCSGKGWTELRRALEPEHYETPKVDPGVDLSVLMQNLFGANDEHEEETPRAEELDPGPFPERLLDVPGFVNDLMQHILVTSIRPQPVLALGASLAALATCAGRRVCDELNNRTNLYLVGAAPSGSGKEKARKIVKDLLCLAPTPGRSGLLLGPEEFVSDAGLVRSLEVFPARIYLVDEIGKFFEAVSGARHAPWMVGIISTLMKLYSQADTIFLGKAYADEKRTEPIVQPCAVLYGTTVPENFLSSLSVSSLEDGFLARVLILEASEAPRQHAPRRDIPQSLRDRVAWWCQLQPGEGDLAWNNPVPQVIHADDQAVEVWDDLTLIVDRQKAKSSREGKAIWSRVEENARKLALVRACSRAGDGPLPDITGADAQWASDLAVYLARRLLYLATRWVSQSQHEANQQRVLRILDQEGGRIRVYQMNRKLRWLPERDRRSLLEDMLKLGLISKEDCPRPGKKPVPYYVLPGRAAGSILGTRVRIAADPELVESCHLAKGDSSMEFQGEKESEKNYEGNMVILSALSPRASSGASFSQPGHCTTRVAMSAQDSLDPGAVQGRGS